MIQASSRSASTIAPSGRVPSANQPITAMPYSISPRSKPWNGHGCTSPSFSTQPRLVAIQPAVNTLMTGRLASIATAKAPSRNPIFCFDMAQACLFRLRQCTIKAISAATAQMANSTPPAGSDR